MRDAVIAWQNRRGAGAQPWGLPVVAETWDGWLNDINGFHVKAEHVFARPRRGARRPGGGRGRGRRHRHDLLRVQGRHRHGLARASTARHGGYTVGVLVQANFGLRRQLRIAGVPVGREITEGTFRDEEAGSIIIVVATDAPLLPHQLEAPGPARRPGLARTGSVAGNGSGDLFLAFSTANAGVGSATSAVPPLRAAERAP